MTYFDKIKDKATFIAFPVDDKYGAYDIDNINRLPVSDDTYKYKGWKENGHHYTTQYHRDIVIPKICELLGIDFDFQRDFHDNIPRKPTISMVGGIGTRLLLLNIIAI